MEYLIVFLAMHVAQSMPVENSRMPLLNNLRAPLVAELDVTNLNMELKGYIDMNVYDQVNQTCHAKIETAVDDKILELSSDMLKKLNGEFAGLQQRIANNFTSLEESLRKEIANNLTTDINLFQQRNKDQFISLEESLRKENKELQNNFTIEINKLNLELKKDHKRLVSYLENLQIIESSFPHKLVDCTDLIGITQKSGVYLIQPGETLKFKTYCDMETDGGGWTVFQRRFNGFTDFYRDWNDYKEGFGYPHIEFWMGNEKLSQMTSQRSYELRINLEDYSGATAFAKYSLFSIGDESTKYKLTISGYYGTAGDSLDYNNNQAFSTKESDNDQHSVNCAVDNRGGWWYKYCTLANLNGPYGNTGSDSGMRWYLWNKNRSMKITSMMIRRKRT